ncbi:MAG: serine/threonine protein phosphatase [Gammaproteobacteria bacterium]|nr:serine/threonine protein phosphatase [Gammaproteobacteria bacterium]MCP4993924.1 serine/threonine protein phosphatase [Gammaproteobacteria bacterium]
MVKQSSKQLNKFIERLKESFFGLAQCKNLNLTEAYRLEEKKVRLRTENYPIQLNLGPEGKMLHIYPELPINHSKKQFQEERYIIFDPKTYYNEVSGFLRINAGEKLILGEDKETEKNLLNLPKGNTEGYLSITNKDGTLIFKAIDDKYGACISPLLKDKQLNRISKRRQAKLKRLRSIFGGPIELLPADDALSLIQRVNKEMEHEVYRAPGANEQPGGVVELPSDITPLLIGDLHAKIDNLLVILSQSGFLSALKKGHASLIILGDAVHSEDRGKLEDMNDSMLIMDLIFKLKLRFPKQVFYLRGNHDSFSEEIGKQGVPQGLLWEKALIKTRGKAYRNEMTRFYKSLPYIAYSKKFIACHAGPPTSSTSRKELINIRNSKKLMREVTNNRVRRPNSPAGYFKKEIKKLRKYFKLAPETPVIVGHTPLTNDDTLWERAGDIDNHYVIYGSDDQWVGVMTQVGNRVYPFRYPTEHLIPLINAIEK